MTIKLKITEIRLNNEALLAKIEAARRKTLENIPAIIQATITDTSFAVDVKPDSIVTSADRVSVYLHKKDAWDIKAAMLPHAYKFDKTGSPYVDVPLSLRNVPPDINAMLSSVADKLRRYDIITNPINTQRMFVFGDNRVTVNIKHKVGLYEDSLRSGSGWNTIRRISKNSLPTSWWYPGTTLDSFNKDALVQMVHQVFKKTLHDDT